MKRYIYFLLAAVSYLLVHEGMHMINAVIQGSFEGIRLMPLGIEVMIKNPVVYDYRLGLFSLLSSITTVSIGWLLFILRHRIIKLKQQSIKNYLCYTTMLFMVLDPFYLSLLSFFVGGDINGITQGFNLSHWIVRAVAFLLALVGTYAVRKIVLPLYVEDYLKYGRSYVEN